MFCVNRDDPSLFVPRRAGAGMDLKLGNPWGLGCAVFVGLVALALVVVTLAMSLWARAPGVACLRPRCRLPAAGLSRNTHSNTVIWRDIHGEHFSRGLLS